MATATSAPPAADSTPVRQPLTVSRTRVAVGLAVLLPVVYVTYWQLRVAAELRAFGRNLEDRRLSAISSRRTLLAMTVGWILVLPALVQLGRAARDVQRAEELKFERAGSVSALTHIIVTCELVALIVAVAFNAAVLIPIAVLVASIAEIVVLQPRLNRLWREEGRSLPWGLAPRRAESLPVVSPRLRVWVEGGWSSCPRWLRAALKGVGWLLGVILVILLGYAVYALGRSLIAEDRSGTFDGVVTTAAVVGTCVGISAGLGWALRRVVDGRLRQLLAARDRIDRELVTLAGLGLALAVLWLWSARPLFHGVMMPFYQWPLATWIPIVLGLVFTATCVALSLLLRRGAQAGLRAGVIWRTPVTVVLWIAFVSLLPGWQGHALYEATTYAVGELP
jgi:hypothetical protein